MEHDPSVFIKCDCGGCSVLEVSFDKEYEQFNLAVWVYHPGEPALSKKERIRWCDRIMKTGRPWADHTIVNKQDAQRLAEFLKQHLPRGKTSK